MSYTPPAANAVDASWGGEGAYTPPASNAVDASWSASTQTGQVSAPSMLGAPAALGVAATLARIAVTSPLGAPALLGDATRPVEGLVVAPGPLASASVVGAPVVVARGAVASPLAAPTSIGRAVIAGRAAIPSPLGAPALGGTVVRYELRGEVRDQGVLVNRRVRAYLRATGALVASADTVGGLFALPVGFATDEYYLVPINLSGAATDFAPPCANRVTSVLAMDVAA